MSAAHGTPSDNGDSGDKPDLSGVKSFREKVHLSVLKTADLPRAQSAAASVPHADDEKHWDDIMKQVGLVAMASGWRNDACNRHGLPAFRMAITHGFDLDRVEDELYRAMELNGYVDSDGKERTQTTIDSARTKAEAAGAYPPRPGGGYEYTDLTLTDANGEPIVDKVNEVDADGQPTPAAQEAQDVWANARRKRASEIRLEREARQMADAQDAEAADNHPTEAPALTSLLLTRSDLRDLPEPEPLIADTIDQGTTGLLYGKWGTYKSFIALDWAASVATGRPWQGRATVKRRVLYVAAEGAFGLRARVDAWERGWHTQIADGELEILPRPVNLTNAAEAREMAAVIRWGGYSFIFFDTIARCMVGGDENSARDCGMVVDSLNRLRECTPDGRGVVMGVHHSGKDAKTLRGSSAFEGGVDTVYFASRDGAVVTLEREKRKDGPQLDHHELRLDLIDGTESGVICPHRGVGKLDRSQDLITTYRHHFPQTGASRADLQGVRPARHNVLPRTV